MLRVKLYHLPLDGQGDYFHPALVQLPDHSFLLTTQQVLSSDHYGCPMYAQTKNLDAPWSKPAMIEAFKNNVVSEQITEGIADPRPFNIPGSDKVVVFTCNTYYSDKGALFWDKEKKSLEKTLPQFPVYSVFTPGTGWSERKELRGGLMEKLPNARSACTQITYTPDNKLLLPVYFENGRVDFHGYESPRFSVCVIKASWQGDDLLPEEISNVFSLEVERGLCEPSIFSYQGKYYLTIRAEDGFGYWSASEDPMRFPELTPWRFDDGEVLQMSSTQQHWFQLEDRLYLAYTRNAFYNAEVTRYRAPLFAAEFLPATGTLCRQSETAVVPYLRRDGVPGLLGNFHCLSLNDGTALICDAALFHKPGATLQSKRDSEVLIAHVSR